MELEVTCFSDQRTKKLPLEPCHQNMVQQLPASIHRNTEEIARNVRSFLSRNLEINNYINIGMFNPKRINLKQVDDLVTFLP